MRDTKVLTNTIADQFLTTPNFRPIHPAKIVLSKFALILAFILPPCQAEAAKVHLIAVADTKDKTIGEIVRSDINRMTSALATLGKKSLLPPVVLIEEKCRPDVINQVLNQIKVGSDDTVVFYFSGHGAYDKTNGQFLQIPRLNKAGNISRSLLRDKIKRMVETKQIRLGVFMTDMCNLRKVIEMPRKIAPAAQAPASEVVIEDKPLFQSLFLDSAGFVDVSSASPDEAALTYPEMRFADNKERVYYLQAGSLYAGAFIEMMNLNQKLRFSWETFLRLHLAPKVNQEFLKTYPTGIDLPDGVKMQFTQTVMFTSAAKLIRGTENKQEERIADALPGMGENQLPNIQKPKAGRINLGIGPDLIIYTVQTPQGPRNGVRIGSIIEDSPAAGRLDIGDIILSINDRPTATPKQFSEAITKSEGDLKIVGWNIRNRKVELFPPILIVSNNHPNRLGVRLDPQIYTVQTLDGPRKGVRIASIVPDTPAAGRLDVDDIIISINNKPTPTAESFKAALQASVGELKIIGWNMRSRKVEIFPTISLVQTGK